VLPHLPLSWLWSLQSQEQTHQQPQEAKPVAAEIVKPPDQTEKGRPATAQAAVQPPEQADPEKLAAQGSEQEKAASALIAELKVWVDVQKALGLRFAPSLTEDLRKTYQIKDGVDGVLITAVEPNSNAAQKGFSEGYLVIGVAGETVSGLGDVIHRVD